MGERDEACLQLARAQRGVISRAQAMGLGINRSAIDRRVASRTWVPWLGAYLVAGIEEGWFSEAAAAALAFDGAVVGAAGAFIWELDGFAEETPITVYSPHHRHLAAEGATVSKAAWLRPELITVRRGVRVLQPAHAVLHLGEHVTRDELEGALDDVLRRSFTTWDELEALSRAPAMLNRPGPILLRELLMLRAQRQHTGSLLETRALQLLRNADFPNPVLQYPIRVNKDVTIHADFAYPQHNLLIETVGKEAHASELWQFERDCQRQNSVSVLRQFTTLYYTWRRIHDAPQEVLRDVARLIGLPLQDEFRVLERKGGRPLLLTGT